MSNPDPEASYPWIEVIGDDIDRFVLQHGSADVAIVQISAHIETQSLQLKRETSGYRKSFFYSGVDFRQQLIMSGKSTLQLPRIHY